MPEKNKSRPVGRRRDGKTGFLGGFMYFVFVISISIIIACIGWMAASDVLALNKEPVTAEVTLPEDIFTPGTLEETDEDGVTTERKVDIADIDAVAQILKDAGIIEYKPLFKLYAAISDTKYKIDPGTYTLSTEFDYRAIVKKMQFGSDSQVRTMVTFPEGYSVKRIFRTLEENKICKYEELMECAANHDFKYEFLEDIPYGEASRLEGYLFPDTYEFYQGMTPVAAINTFLSIFQTSRLTAEMLELSAEHGFTFRQILALASLIEKEAANDDERGDIASVIYNRLAANMTLGVDAAILYVLEEGHGAPTGADFEIDTPYNLRMYQGLPPTPICNPGMPSITAALKPNDTNYYYYALDMATMTHRFFTNIDDFTNFTNTQDYSS
ncbi:MAG: endolytic transglycosylase MltG [Oscillospiraceae bacterium]|jgi:UPF0755 protein|nr:endolytic transglycosylase MltG [Oscillospiraceae bacterium]